MRFRIKTALYCVLLLSPLVKAKEVAVLYVKNNTSQKGTVIVDGVVQGFCGSGETVYIVKEGFVTPDSGKNGNPTQESHGGWSSNEAITVKMQTSISDGDIAEGVVKVSANSDGKAFAWFGEKEAGAEPDSLEIERSVQIHKGGAKPLQASEELAADGKENDGAIPKELVGKFSMRYQTPRVEIKEDGTIKIGDSGREAIGKFVSADKNDGQISGLFKIKGVGNDDWEGTVTLTSSKGDDGQAGVVTEFRQTGGKSNPSDGGVAGLVYNVRSARFDRDSN